jgi:hypothetical protein
MNGELEKLLRILKKDLLDNSIIDEIDFLNIFKNKQENISKAKNWANNLKEKI